jgi:hypothetical protein
MPVTDVIENGRHETTSRRTARGAQNMPWAVGVGGGEGWTPGACGAAAIGAAGGRRERRGGGQGRLPGAVLVIRVDGAGALLAVDRWGRLSMPVWWRHVCVPAGTAAVATRAGECPLVVLAPTGVLDGLANVLVGERR